MYRFSKYLISILLLKSFVTELRHENAVQVGLNANCRSVKDNFYRNQAQHNLCINGNNVRYKFINDIFQDMFGAFANDPRIALA